MQLTNKTAIITGAAQGIGLGITEALAKEGYNVVLLDINQDTLDDAVEKLSFYETEIIDIKCNVADKTEVDEMISKVKEKFGSVDIVVNNAGIYPFKAFAELTEADWDRVIDINLKGTFLVTQAALTLMKEGGRIINISSIASKLGMASLTAYCASKGGVNAFTRALSVELAPKGINVNAIAPGAIETPGTASTDEIKQMTLAAIPLKRMGTPEDIAGSVVYLASEAGSYVTGQVIVVDGGWTIQ